MDNVFLKKCVQSKRLCGSCFGDVLEVVVGGVDFVFKQACVRVFVSL